MAEQTLLERAAVIRDEQEEAHNTANRVGSALVLAAQEIARRVTGIRSTSSDVSAWIHLSFTDEDGTPREVRIDLPVLSDSAAGVITPRQYQTLSEAIDDVKADVERNAAEIAEVKIDTKVNAETIAAIRLQAAYMADDIKQVKAAAERNAAAIATEVQQRKADDASILERITNEEQFRKKVDDELAAQTAALAQQVEELRRQHRADIDALAGTLDPEVIANMAEILMRLSRLEGLLTL